jgi:hypothetical protein
MKTRKSIAYAYPTSEAANELGQPGFYVCQYVKLETGEWSTPFIAQGHDVFDDKNDPDLLALFNESDGEVCPYYASHHHT